MLLDIGAETLSFRNVLIGGSAFFPLGISLFQGWRAMQIFLGSFNYVSSGLFIERDTHAPFFFLFFQRRSICGKIAGPLFAARTFPSAFRTRNPTIAAKQTARPASKLNPMVLIKSSPSSPAVWAGAIAAEKG